MLGGLAIYLPIANFLQRMCAKNCENRLAVDKVMPKISRFTFLVHPVYPRPTIVHLTAFFQSLYSNLMDEPIMDGRTDGRVDPRMHGSIDRSINQ